MFRHLNVGALSSTCTLLATMYSLTTTHLRARVVVVTTHSHLPGRHCLINLSSTSKQHLLRCIDHARVLVVLALAPGRLLELLLLEHLLVLQLLHLL